MKAPVAILMLVSFLISFGIGPIPTYAQADEFHLPAPGVMVHLSPPLDPPILKGIKVHPDHPFQFDFILDKGDSSLSSPNASVGDPALKEEATKLIKYFLASLTIPENDLWVNLSPYEKDRIIPNSFGLTEMGRDLLAEDYMLKQITASLIYPEDEVGKKFWKRIYAEASKRYGTTNIPVNTFNKVWIVPQKAVVFENAKAGTAYVIESKLKVMLEQDYLSLEKHAGIRSKQTQFKGANQLGSQIVREIVIPELTTEINENKNFARLRQVYNSLILATWYKMKIKNSILAQVYADKNKIAGVSNNDPQEKEKIYQKYLRAFKKGVFNYIKEDIDPATQEMIPRKYFSGGVALSLKPVGASSLAGTDLEVEDSPAKLPNGIRDGAMVDVKADASEMRNPTSQDLFGTFEALQAAGPSREIYPLPQDTEDAISTLWDLVNTGLGSPVTAEKKPRFVLNLGQETSYADFGQNIIGLASHGLWHGMTWGEEIMHMIRFQMRRGDHMMGPFSKGAVDEFFGRLGSDYAREASREVSEKISLYNGYFKHDHTIIWSEPKTVIDAWGRIVSLSEKSVAITQKADDLARVRSLVRKHLSPYIELLEDISNNMSTDHTGVASTSAHKAGLLIKFINLYTVLMQQFVFIQQEVLDLHGDDAVSDMYYVNTISKNLNDHLNEMLSTFHLNKKDEFDKGIEWIRNSALDDFGSDLGRNRFAFFAFQGDDENAKTLSRYKWHLYGYIAAELFMRDNPDWKKKMPELLKMPDEDVYNQFIRGRVDSHIAAHLDSSTQGKESHAMSAKQIIQRLALPALFLTGLAFSNPANLKGDTEVVQSPIEMVSSVLTGPTKEVTAFFSGSNENQLNQPSQDIESAIKQLLGTDKSNAASKTSLIEFLMMRMDPKDVFEMINDLYLQIPSEKLNVKKDIIHALLTAIGNIAIYNPAYIQKMKGPIDQNSFVQSLENPLFLFLRAILAQDPDLNVKREVITQLGGARDTKDGMYPLHILGDVLNGQAATGVSDRDQYTQLRRLAAIAVVNSCEPGALDYPKFQNNLTGLDEKYATEERNRQLERTTVANARSTAAFAIFKSIFLNEDGRSMSQDGLLSDMKLVSPKEAISFVGELLPNKGPLLDSLIGVLALSGLHGELDNRSVDNALELLRKTYGENNDKNIRIPIINIIKRLLEDQVPTDGEKVIIEDFLEKVSKAMLHAGESKVDLNGGIDLTPANMHLETQNAGEGIKFHLDPAMLKQLQNAPGFTPSIISIQPMNDLRGFLGVNT